VVELRRARPAPGPFAPEDQHRVAELVREEARGCGALLGTREQRARRKRLEELAVRRAGLVHAREHGVDDPRDEAGAHVEPGRARAGGGAAAVQRRASLERADDRGAHRDHAAAPRTRRVDGPHRRGRDLEPLGERKEPVDSGIACGGQARRVRQRREADPAAAHLREHGPREWPAC
jgi:hypothetical protein